jgi:hypothetical protein
MSTGVHACTYGSDGREGVRFVHRQPMNGPGAGSRIRNSPSRMGAQWVRTPQCGEAARRRLSRSAAGGGC